MKIRGAALHRFLVAGFVAMAIVGLSPIIKKLIHGGKNSKF